MTNDKPQGETFPAARHLYFIMRSLLFRGACYSQQAGRHPLADALRQRIAYADAAVMPFIADDGMPLLLVILRLFQTQHDAVGDFLPVLLLYAAQDKRQPCSPIFFGRALVLFRYRQIINGRKRLACEFIGEPPLDFLVGQLRIIGAKFLRATEKIGDAHLFILHDCLTGNLTFIFDSVVKLAYTYKALITTGERADNVC